MLRCSGSIAVFLASASGMILDSDIVAVHSQLIIAAALLCRWFFIPIVVSTCRTFAHGNRRNGEGNVVAAAAVTCSGCSRTAAVGGR